MAKRTALALAFLSAVTAQVDAAEVTIQNDSVTDFSAAVIVYGFVQGEQAASWLTSPCDGALVATQVLWQSPTGTQAAVIGSAIRVHRAGSFPTPGVVAAEIGGPVLTDGALNEWRYLDENNTVPLNVPVTSGETVAVAFEFADPPTANESPSLVRDTNGITASRNAIYADLGSTFAWFDASVLGVSGDWVIRAVVNCGAVATNADVAVTMSATPTAYTPGNALQYTITLDNAGPATATNVTLVDVFPTAFQSAAWTCSATGGASCPAASGSGNITGTAALPSSGQLSFIVNGTVAPGTTGTLSNSMTAVVVAPTDPNTSNNIATLNLPAASAPTEADVSVSITAAPEQYIAGSPLQYTIVVANDGPDPATTSITDAFPAAYLSPTWSCLATAGAACPGTSGNGDIAGNATLPAGSQVSFTVNGTVAAGTTATLANTASAAVQAPANDPSTGNNSATILVDRFDDVIFANGFDSPPTALRIIAAKVAGARGPEPR